MPEVDCNASISYTLMMSSSLTIRNLAEPVKQKLRLRAAAHQRSIEAEVRDILAQAVGESTPPAVAQGSARGLWKGRQTTDDAMRLTRGLD